MLTVGWLLGAALSAANACEPPRPRDRSPCSDRVGHCFNLEIDGQSVVPLDDEPLRERLQGAVSQPVCWQLTAPVSGALDAVAEANELTQPHLGPLFNEMEVVVTALEGQEIPTRKGVRTDPTVRIGGVPMQTMVDVIDVAALPDGAYVATFRVRGPEGWDRKAVYLTVERDGTGDATDTSGKPLVDATAPYDPDNVFARILRGEAPAQVVYENEHALAFHDICPAAPVHVLVIPKGPYSNVLQFIAEASDAEKLGLLDAIAETARVMKVDASGFRLLSNTGEHAGQTVPHLHFHIRGGERLGGTERPHCGGD